MACLQLHSRSLYSSLQVENVENVRVDLVLNWKGLWSMIYSLGI